MEEKDQALRRGLVRFLHVPDFSIFPAMDVYRPSTRKPGATGSGQSRSGTIILVQANPMACGVAAFSREFLHHFGW